MSLNLKQCKDYFQADVITAYLKFPKESTERLLQLMGQFRKFIEYKISIQKLVIFPPTGKNGKCNPK